MAANLTTAISKSLTLGWQPGCTTRGTWDIIWSCAQTLGLCAWVSVCTNCPAPENGEWDLVTDKFFFLLMTLLGPEFVFLLALGQYQSAKESIQEFENLGYVKDEKTGYEGWTVTHGFYADMGGIHVRPKGWKSFPVNAKQLAWLVRHDYLERPSHVNENDCIRKISLRSIKARGKIDRLAKLITVIQALQFSFTTIARFITGLSITTMELTVLANIFCSLMVYICWWNKPTDVEVGHDPFPLSKTIEEIIVENCPIACDNHKIPYDYYHNTPLDFISREEGSSSLHWRYYVNILRWLGLLRVFNLHYNRPSQRINSFNFPRDLSRRADLIIAIIALGYTGWFLGAWNFYFPSTYEKHIWRAVTLTQSSLCLAAAIWEIVWEGPRTENQKSANSTTALVTSESTQVPAAAVVCPAQVEKGGNIVNKSILTRLRKLWNRPCNNETGNFPSLAIPLRSLLVLMPISAAYCICRWFILVEDILALRSLPASAFQEVNWAPYWPWF